MYFFTRFTLDKDGKSTLLLKKWTFFPSCSSFYIFLKVDPFSHQINANTDEKAKVGVAQEASEVETTIDCIDLNEHEYESIATTTYR